MQTQDRAAATLQQFADKLAALPIGREEIKVFGVIRTNVHVVCMSRDTASKWVQALSQIFTGAKVACVQHVIYAKANKGTNLNPTRRDGWLIAVAA